MTTNPFLFENPGPLPFKKQSVEVPGTKRPGQSAHYRNAVWGLLDPNDPRWLKKLPDAFEAALSMGKDRKFLGRRPLVSKSPLKYADHYVWETYGEVDVRRRAIGSALHALFSKGELGGGEHQTVGIWSQNRPEWQILDLAMQAYQKVSVSLYDTLGADSVEYIINHAHLTVVFTSADHIHTLLKTASKYPQLKLIVSLDDLSPETSRIVSTWGQTHGIRVIDLKELEAFGKENLIEPLPATPDSLASICYTSGTTNNPKGVLLTHQNLSLAVQTNLLGLTLPPESVLLSYLPLAHIYGRISELCCLSIGGAIGYFTGDPLRLLEDAQILKPNFLPSVPRVLNRVYQAAMVAAKAPGIKGALFRRAVEVKLEKLRTTGDNTHAFWDRIVFKKIQAVLGGNVQLLTSGSAPISPDAMDFLKIAFACNVEEGYGMTENAATCTRCWSGDPSSSGTVGPPQAVNEVKLVDVPAMGYSADNKPNPRGELCVRGANCFTVYYRDEKNTKETVDEEGWLHTGDIGEIDQCGRVKIIDRVKNIMKLAQGEYVALEKIENLYSASPVVAQLYVHGDGLQSYIIAVVVPDPVQLAEVASKVTKKRVTAEDQRALAEAVKDEKVKSSILATMTKEAKKNQLKGFETIKRIHLSLEPFTVDEGTLTPTLKIKRKDAYAKYKRELDGLYALGEPSSSSTKL